MHVRTGREAGRSLQPDHLTSYNRFTDVRVGLEQVCVQGGDPPAVSDHDKVAVPEVAVPDRHHEAVRRSHHGRSQLSGDVNPGVEVLVRPVWRLQQHRRGTEWLRDHERRHRPRKLKPLDRLAHWQLLIDKGQPDADLRLRPRGLVRALDQVLHLRFEELRQVVRPARRLVGELVLSVLQLGQQVTQLAAHVGLLAHHLIQRAQVRVQQDERVVLAVEVVLARLQVRLQLGEVRLELRLQRMRALPGDDRVRGGEKRLVKVARPRDQQPEGVRLPVDGSRHRSELLLLDLDPRFRVGDLLIERRDLIFEVGDDLLFLRDLVVQGLLRGGELVERRRDSLLSGQRRGDVAAEPRLELRVSGLVRIDGRGRAGRARVGRRAGSGARRG